MAANKILISVILFIAAGLCEIGGGWLMWQWLREGKKFLGPLLEHSCSFYMVLSRHFSLRISVEFMLPTAAFLSFCLSFGAGWWMVTLRIDLIWLAVP